MLSRARSYLDRYLFLDAPPSPRLSRDRVLLYAAIAVLATTVQILRVWSLRPLETIFGEDASVYLADAQGSDPLTAVTTPYNGYLQVSSRVIAEAVEKLPVDWWAAAMAICGALVVTGCAFVVWRTSAAHVQNRWLRATLAAMVVLLGVVGTEMLGTVVNSIWFIAFACFWVLLWRPPGLAAAIGGGVLLFIGAASHSVLVFFAPLLLLRAIAARDRRDWVIVAGFVLGLIFQLALSYDQIGSVGDNGEGPRPVAATGQPFSTDPYWDWNLVPAYGQRVVGGAIAGHDPDAWLWEHVGWLFVAVLAALLVGLVVWALRTPRTRLLVPLTVAISIAIFLIIGYVRWGAGGFALFWPQGESVTIGGRYVVLPALLLLAAILIQLDAWSRQPAGERPDRRPALALAAAGVIVVCALASFRVDPSFEGGPTWSTAVDGARATCRAGPAETVDVVTVITPYGQGTMPLDCDRLR
jgi:hypothetical protein